MSSQVPEFEARRTDDVENIPSNTSDNREFGDVLKANMSRRNVMVGTLAAAGATFLAPAPAQAFGYGWFKRKPKKGSLIEFEALGIDEAIEKGADGQMVTVSSDYEYDVLIPWGTPIDPNSGVPEYTGDPDTRPSSKDAEQQIGLGHDGMWFYPGNLPRILRWEARRGRELPAHIRNKLLWDRYGVLCLNHEYGINPHVFGKQFPESLEDVRLSQAIHGVSVVALYQSRSGKWKNVSSKFNRRITVNTPVEFSGPVAGSVYLENKAIEGKDPKGTVNNCGSGPTPWGTYLTCEENFNAYFGVKQDPDFLNGDNVDLKDPLRLEGLDRYGFLPGGAFNDYQWWNFDPRFDYSDEGYVNEINRFGWCVEIDPFDKDAKPIKRTAMGRFKHEAAAFMPEKFDNRAVCYMGDDQRFDYCYKYVSDKPWRKHLKRGESPLDHGTLYVARFDDDNTGEWIALDINNPAYPELNSRFKDQAELLTYTRIAADIVGATKMDRPEWTTIGKDGEVYWTLTNNTNRTEADAANPNAPNPDGHIIETKDKSDTKFTWEIFILAKDTRGTEGVFTDPDAAWADAHGRLFIGTDGGQPDGLQDQLVVFDTTSKTPSYKRLLMGVASDEITGITTTPDYRTMFTNTQHPGNGFPTRTNFPAPFDGVTIPRDCTIVLRRKDGGIVGS